jgi:hypothetical protein
LRRRAAETVSIGPESESFRALDALLARCRREGWRTLVVLMPENPLLEDDRANRYHRPALRERSTALVDEAIARYGHERIDARHWLAPEEFMDFDHPLYALSRFEEKLALEIARAARS